MMFKNPNSNRQNAFRKVYDSKEYNSVLEREPSKFPFLVDVELTNHCNLKCFFCGQQAMTRKKGFMSEEVFKKVVDECAEYNTPIRLIRWGEPFLHKKIVGLSKYVKEKGLPLHITTNGLLVTEEQMSELVEMELDSIIFSFQGATKEGYERMRNNNKYDELKSNILRLVELRGEKPKPFIHISSTMTNETKEEINGFVGLWGHIVDSVGVGKTNLSRLKSYPKGIKEQETINRQYKPCLEVYRKLSVDWDGKVSCCCMDYDNFLTVGDVGETTLFGIWHNSEELRLIRKMLEKQMFGSFALCRTCYNTYEEFG